MSARLFVLRPEPGLTATLAAAKAMELDALGAPLAKVEAVAWTPPARSEFDALLVGSANAVRHGGASLEILHGATTHVVGTATADAARAAGLVVGRVGSGGLQALVASMAGSGLRLLRLAGEKRLPLDPPGDVAIVERVVYRLAYQSLPDGLASQLTRGGVVLLHSGEAAVHFARECDRLAIARSGLLLAALAPRIAEAAGEGWARIASAPDPTDAALLALARDMCQ